MRTLVILLFAFLASGCSDQLTLTAWQKNREAVGALRKDAPDLAVVALSEGLASSPFRPELHLNLGLAVEKLKKPDDAEKSFRSAEALSRSSRDRFAARFNLGVLNGNGKKVEEALQWYQAALEADPASVEAKTNIELLTRAQQGQDGSEDQERESQDGQGEGKPSQDSKGDPQKDKKDPSDEGEGEKNKENRPKEYAPPQPQYKPREFKGELDEGDVKKILGEIKQQEQRIRTEYNRRDVKERPRDKDW